MKTQMRFAARVAGLGLLLLCGVFLTGCGTLPNGRGWGQDAIYPVQWSRIGTAAKNAVLDPVTWVTAGGAALFAIDDWDRKVSNWAWENTPVFGSQQDADEASDLFDNILRAEAYVTLALTPSGEKPLTWGYWKLKGLGVEYLAMEATAVATDFLKGATDRVRPDGSNDRSFPSGHASSSFASLRIANRNLDSMDLPPWARVTMKSGNYLMASATCWARVEARKHYPSDVLAGACLGNIITTFIHDAFMNLPEDGSFSFYLEPSPNAIYGTVTWTF